MAGACDQLVGGDVELLVGVVRMGADRAVHVGKALGDGEHLGVPPDPRRDRDDAADAGRLRARHHGVELAGEIGKIEMAMAVDQHGVSRYQRSRSSGNPTSECKRWPLPLEFLIPDALITDA